MSKLNRLQSIVVKTTIVLCVLFAPYFFSRLMSPTRLVQQKELSHISEYDLGQKNLTVAAYNIAHGRGTAASDSEGGNKEEREKRLEDIAELLKETDADVLILNEVDFDSSWSYGVNQAEYLALEAGYPYWVEQRNLDFRFLWMTWRFGNAILSKYPLTDVQLVKLPAHSTWELILAGKKQAVSSVINFDGQRVRIISAHLSHRSSTLRIQSAKDILEHMQEKPLPTILAGDMNSMPIQLVQPEVKSVQQTAIKVFKDSGQFTFPPIKVPLTKPEMTFHSEDPKLMIDWIFIPKNWTFDSFEVEASTLSDHRLIKANLGLSPVEP